jgi:peptidoglycan/LPS O-acetylase OafA/YrhL
MPLAILGTTLRPQSWFSRLLENPALSFVGRLSYSLYLWQQLFLISHFGADTARLGPLQSSPLNWLMTFACALLSYYLVERPLIRLGHRLAPNVAANQSFEAQESLVPPPSNLF